MRKEELSEREIEIMNETREEWIDRFFNTKEINKEDFKEGIDWIYTSILKKEAPQIVYCDSWEAAVYLISFLRVLQNNNSVKDSTTASVRDSIWDSVSNSIMHAVAKTVRDFVDDSVSVSVWETARISTINPLTDSIWMSIGVSIENSINISIKNSIKDSVSNPIWESVTEAIRDSIMTSAQESIWNFVENPVVSSVMDSVLGPVNDSVEISVEIRNVVKKSVEDSTNKVLKEILEESLKIFNNFSNDLNTYGNFGWVSFYDFFTKIGVLNNEEFNKYSKFIKSGAFQVYEFEKTVFAIQPPTYISRNSLGLLHDCNKKAVSFRDGTGYYFVNGRQVPKWVITKRGAELFELFSKEKNEDIKAGVITVIKEREGNKGLLDFLGAVLVDEKTINHYEGYSETLRLYKTKETYSFLNDRFNKPNQPYCWSEFTCPSTGSVYLIDNSADFTCAVEAAKFLRPSFVPFDVPYQWNLSAN